MGDEEDGNGPENRPQGRRGEVLEVAAHEVGIAFQVTCGRGVDVLQAPTTHYRVVTGDEETRGDAQKTNKLGE